MNAVGDDHDREEILMPVPEIWRRRAARRRPARLRVVRVPAPATPAPDSTERPEMAAATEGAAAASGTTIAAHRWRSLTAALVVALVGVLAAGVTGQQWYEQHRLESAHQAALAAAKQTTVDFVSISASRVDRDLQRIGAGATGGFAEEFSRGMPQVRAAVVENNVESRGAVLRAGLVSGDLDSAVVLVAVDATVKNVRAPEGRLSHYRIQVDLTRDGRSGRWLVSRMQFVG